MKKFKLNSSLIAILIILLIVFVITSVFVYIQSTYSTKVKSIKLTASTGPVAPEYQQTQSIFIAKDSCVFTTERQNKIISTDNCTVLSGKFKDIQKDATTYDLIGKISANEKDSENDLLGGKKYTIEITLNDGSTFVTEADNNFLQSIEPFLDNMNLYVPQFSRLGL